jgi:hypothetical protein
VREYSELGGTWSFDGRRDRIHESLCLIISGNGVVGIVDEDRVLERNGDVTMVARSEVTEIHIRVWVRGEVTFGERRRFSRGNPRCRTQNLRSHSYSVNKLKKR